MSVLVGGGLVGYGLWYFVTRYLSNPSSPSFWLGMLPTYLGAMLLLAATAMKEDWFTNARKYW
jgi:hypothetical protein